MPDYWELTPPFTSTPPLWDEVPEDVRDIVLFEWLWYAIDERLNEIAFDILHRRPDWVNEFRKPNDDEFTYCPLVAAADMDNAEVVEWLLDHGADPVAGNEPLCVVARKLWKAGRGVDITAALRIGKLLLDRGALPDQPCALHGDTPQETFFGVMQQNLAQFILSNG